MYITRRFFAFDSYDEVVDTYVYKFYGWCFVHFTYEVIDTSFYKFCGSVFGHVTYDDTVVDTLVLTFTSFMVCVFVHLTYVRTTKKLTLSFFTSFMVRGGESCTLLYTPRT